MRVRNTNSNNFKKKNSKELISIASDVYYGIEFFTTKESLLGTKKTIKNAPDVVVKDQEVYFNYSFSDNVDFSYIENIFANLQKGDSFNLTDAEYQEDGIGIDGINLSGSYILLDFYPDKKVIKAQKPSSITFSDRINKYKRENFVYVPQVDVSSISSSTPTFGIINYIGTKSLNSFFTYGIGVGNYLKFTGTVSNEETLYRITSVYEDNEGKEVILFKNECIAESLLDTPVFWELFEDPEEKKNNDLNVLDGDDPFIIEIEGELTDVDYFERTAGDPGVTIPCDCDIDEEPPLLPSDPTREQQDRWREWVAKQMKCCQCLLYAEATCNKDCQNCVAWTLYNRRKDINNAVVADERYPCRQARSGEFSGRCQINNKYKSCNCNRKIGNAPDPSLPAEKRCLQSAALACRRIGLGNWKNLPDPTGGANYFMRCGGEPSWMQCNIDAGRCKKVTAAVGDGFDCSTCDTCFYKCESGPQPCRQLQKNGLIILDSRGNSSPNPKYLQYVNLLDSNEAYQTENVGPFAIEGYYPLYTNPDAARDASPTPDIARPGESTVGYHVHVIGGVAYYMPNGLVMNVTQFHGNFGLSEESQQIREPGPPPETRSRQPLADTSVPDPNQSASTTNTPPPPSSPPSPPSGGGYGY